MRVWQRLRDWVNEEARSAQTYRRLAETADLHAAGRAALLRPPDLPLTLDWQAREQPSAAWAERYRPGLETALHFLQQSQHVYDNEVRSEQAEATERDRLRRQERRTRRQLLAAAVLGTVMVVVLSAMGWLYRDAHRERNRANVEAANARTALAEAETAQAKAETADLAARRAAASQGWQREVYSKALIGKTELQQEIKRAVQDRRVVYLQYADPEQRRAVEALRPHLNRAGWSAPGSERVQSAPGSAQIRYFREADGDDARSLSALFKRWGWGMVRPEFIKGFETQSQFSQLEIWLARPNPAELARLLKAIDSPVKDERLKALQMLVDSHVASPAAIAGALGMASAANLDKLTSPGRFNLLYFLARTAPLAWDDKLAGVGRETLARVRTRSEIGKDSLDEIARAERLLVAVAAGEALAPLGAP